MVNALEYVKPQPVDFQQTYINTFIQDCVNAYEGDSEETRMTCPAGALERIFLSLVPAAQAQLSLSPNEEYQALIDVLIANPEKMLPEFIKDWYRMHKQGTEGAFPPETTTEEKKRSLKTFLLSKFPQEETLIDRKIVEFADSIGYDDDDFMYGGKKRRRRRTMRKLKPAKKQKPTKKRTTPKKRTTLRKK